MRAGRLDALILLCIVIGAGWVSAKYLELYDRSGGERAFYQQRFDAAVMDACGRGLVRVVNPRDVPSLTAFLQRSVDGLDCRSIPDDVTTASSGRVPPKTPDARDALAISVIRRWWIGTQPGPSGLHVVAIVDDRCIISHAMRSDGGRRGSSACA